MGEGGALSPQVAARRYRDLLSEVAPLLPLEAARWGDSMRAKPFLPTGPEWNELTAPQGWLFSEFFPNRSQRVIRMFRDDGMGSKMSAPKISWNASSRTVVVTRDNPTDKGEFYLTSDGTDPRIPWTGEPRGRKYTGPFKAEPGDLLRIRLYSGSNWGPISEMTFSH